MLVDEDPSFHRLLAFKLKHEGIEFLAAYGGSEALDLASSNQPALILLEMRLPDQDGLTTLKALRNNPTTKDIPVIMLSSEKDPGSKVRAFELGAMDFVTKPFDVHELRARIQAAVRIHRLMSMLEKRAQIDGLTGLWNRTYFNDRLKAELDCAKRNKSAMSLVICDLDHFKKINDTFGHPAGDAVLQAFAKVVVGELRSYDVACRYGGEEFAIILPDAGLPQSMGICERVRKAIESSRWPNYPEIRVTASFGVSDSGLDGGASADAWVAAADKCLYEAKQTGRNRVVAYAPVMAGR
jgi:diguanylate cyclase (GGDEF)-like protein